MKKFAAISTIIVLFLTAVFAAVMAPSAFASASCVYNEQHGWHIVGGSETDHWYETEQECRIALQVPTAMATLMATDDPTETATEEPTEPPVVTGTPMPTETVLPPTETPMPTETVLPPTETPVVTETPMPAPKPKRVNSCERNWEKIKNLVYKDEGYRYFENHSWCKAWLFLRFGIDFDVYKALHP